MIYLHGTCTWSLVHCRRFPVFGRILTTHVLRCVLLLLRCFVALWCHVFGLVFLLALCFLDRVMFLVEPKKETSNRAPGIDIVSNPVDTNSKCLDDSTLCIARNFTWSQHIYFSYLFIIFPCLGKQHFLFWLKKNTCHPLPIGTATSNLMTSCPELPQPIWLPAVWMLKTRDTSSSKQTWAQLPARTETGFSATKVQIFFVDGSFGNTMKHLEVTLGLRQQLTPKWVQILHRDPCLLLTWYRPSSNQ